MLNPFYLSNSNKPMDYLMENILLLINHLILGEHSKLQSQELKLLIMLDQP